MVLWAGERDFLFSKTSRLALGPTQLPNQGSFLAVSGQGVKLTTHLHLVLKLRMSEALPLQPLYAFMPWTGNFFTHEEIHTCNYLKMSKCVYIYIYIYIYFSVCHCCPSVDTM